jgi:integrase-like protein
MEKIQRSYYFAGMYRKLKKYIKECDSCNRNKNDYRKPTGEMTIEKELPNEPWKKLTADFMEMPKTTNMQELRNTTSY